LRSEASGILYVARQTGVIFLCPCATTGYHHHCNHMYHLAIAHQGLTMTVYR
jgi:hypothetical protein